MLVQEGRVAAIAPAATGEAVVVDAGGCTLLPGLWDAHVHLGQWASTRRRVDLSSAGSAAEAAQIMATAAAARGERDRSPLLGFGFIDGLWADQPDRELLDGRCPDLPVALVSRDLHSAWLNGPALHAAGFPDHPTGRLVEEAAGQALTTLGDRPPDEVDAWVAEALAAAARRGVTGLLDFEYQDPVAVWRRRAERGRPDLRIAGAVYPPDLDDAIAAGWQTGAAITGTQELVEFGPLKLFLDGSLNTRTACCYAPYPGEGSGHGLVRTSLEEAVALMARAAGHGIHPALHAIGDRANATALAAFEAVPGPGRIEHAQLVAWEDLPRFGRPGLTLGVQPAHATDDRDVADVYWAGRTDRAYAYASLLEAGATLELGSDAPVTPLDPWLGISAAAFRTGDERPAWHPEQAIRLDDALAAAARGRRRIEPGMPADLTLVGRDPATLDAAGLRAMPVAATIVGGRFVFRDL